MVEKTEDEKFWEEFNALLIQIACLIERRKLKRPITTADLRRAGKQALCERDTSN